MASKGEAVDCPNCKRGLKAGWFTECPHCGKKLPKDIAKVVPLKKK